jgi:hypothetical protein
MSDDNRLRPAYRHSHYLSDWPNRGVEVICCKGTTMIPVKMLLRDHGDRTFQDLLARLRCSRCRGWPKRVVELIPVRR